MIRVKDVVDEVFQDYHKPSMLISMCDCNWKCATEGGFPITICQNSTIAQQKDIKLNIDQLCKRYLNNNITSAIIFAGLEPMLQFDEILFFIEILRNKYRCMDDVVIYTGYEKHEVPNKIRLLSKHKNIVMKFGRYVPNSNPVMDEILGVTLASSNQYAERIS